MKNQVPLTALLQVVGTPIGNLSDMSMRARNALMDAHFVACEDTRRTGQLYRLLGLEAPKMVSYYKENEGPRTAQIIEILREGHRVVLVSDGGMPGVSDPGAHLVAAARVAGVRVEVIPGPSAVVTAVAGTGFEGGFVFVGFPERKATALRKQLQDLMREQRMLVFYESPQRIRATVEAALEVFGNRQAWLARELTKMHEEWVGPDLAELAAELGRRDEVKGECVLVIKGSEAALEGVEVTDTEIVTKLKAGGSVKDVAAWLADMTETGKKEAYARVQALKG